MTTFLTLSLLHNCREGWTGRWLLEELPSASRPLRHRCWNLFSLTKPKGSSCLLAKQSVTAFSALNNSTLSSASHSQLNGSGFTTGMTRHYTFSARSKLAGGVNEPTQVTWESRPLYESHLLFCGCHVNDRLFLLEDHQVIFKNVEQALKWGSHVINRMHVFYQQKCARVCVLEKVTINRRLLIGRDGHLDQSEAYDLS